MSHDRLKLENYLANTGKILLKQEFSDGLQISMNSKDCYYTFDNSLLFTESIQNTTQPSTLNHNVQFLPCQHRGVGIMQYVYALNPVASFYYSRTLPQRSSRQGCDIVNPGT